MYKPQDYWQNRLRGSFNLEGVGCLGRGMQYNTYLYRAKVRALERGLRSVGAADLNGMSVLDLGTGVGFWIEYFLSHGAAFCVGVDIADVAVSSLSKKFSPDRATFLCSDISGLDLPERIARTFQIIIAADVLYHIVNDGLLEKAIANIARLSGKGAWLIFTDVLHSPEPVPFSPDSHVKWRPIERWRALLRQNHFRIRAQVPMYVFLHSAVSGPRLIRYCANLIHYVVTRKVSETPFLGKAYLWFLSLVDSLLTTAVGTSMFMVFAQKVTSGC